MFWNKIDSAPTSSRKMFVVIAKDVVPFKGSTTKYTSDPYCVWFDNGKFVRWPHEFQPTHWALLPEEYED